MELRLDEITQGRPSDHQPSPKSFWALVSLHQMAVIAQAVQGWRQNVSEPILRLEHHRIFRDYY